MKRIVLQGEISIEDQNLIIERLKDEFEVAFINPDIQVFRADTESVAAKGIGMRAIIEQSINNKTIGIVGYTPSATSLIDKLVEENKKILEIPILLHCNDMIDPQIFDDKPKRNKYDKPYKYHK